MIIWMILWVDGIEDVVVLCLLWVLKKGNVFLDRLKGGFV